MFMYLNNNKKNVFETKKVNKRMWALGIPFFTTGTRSAVYAKYEFNLHFEVSMSYTL